MIDENEAQRAVDLRLAREIGSKHYFTGKPCRNGHIALRLTSTRSCCECSKEFVKNNFEKLKNYKKDYKNKNKEKYKFLDKLSYERNKEERKNAMKIYAQKNKSLIFEIQARRRASKKQRIPLWLTKEHKQIIRSIYDLSIKRTQWTGVQHHVDHIVPLQGKTVSGLHVPWNLQVIEATENHKKKNFSWPDMWERI